MSAQIMGRLFLVGCPRSGTTLLQSMIAAHPAVTSFPETHFLVATGKTQRGRRLTRLGLASPELRAQLVRFLDQIGCPQLRAHLPRHGLWVRQYARALVASLDTLTLERGKEIWLEKTPGHLHYVDQIARIVPGAKFIHLWRHGPDVVASLYDVTRAYPERWGGTYDVDWCISRWLADIEITRACHDRPGHLVVRYRDLVEQTEAVLARICRFIGVPYDGAMVTGYQAALQHVILAEERWKQDVGQEIRNTNGQRFARIFDGRERAYVLERLAGHGL